MLSGYLVHDHLMNLMGAALPLVSVLLGAGITYWLNVKSRQTSKIEDVFHDALKAVAVSAASQNWVSHLTRWDGATDEDYARFNETLGRENTMRYATALAEARAALARAAVYDDSLQVYFEDHAFDSIPAHFVEISARLARHIR